MYHFHSKPFICLSRLSLCFSYWNMYIYVSKVKVSWTTGFRQVTCFMTPLYALREVEPYWDGHYCHDRPSVLSLFSYYFHVHFYTSFSSVPAVVHIHFCTASSSVPAVVHIHFCTASSSVPAVVLCYSPCRNLQFLCLVCCFIFLVFLTNPFSIYFANSYSAIATFAIRYIYSFVAVSSYLFSLFLFLVCFFSGILWCAFKKEYLQNWYFCAVL